MAYSNVYLVQGSDKTLAAFTDQQDAIQWAVIVSGLEEKSPYRTSGPTVHYVVETWLANYTDWHNDVHVYGDGKVMTQS